MWIALTCHDLFIMNQFIIMPKRNNYDACYMNSAIYTGLFGDSSQRINLKIVFFEEKGRSTAGSYKKKKHAVQYKVVITKISR